MSSTVFLESSAKKAKLNPVSQILHLLPGVGSSPAKNVAPTCEVGPGQSNFASLGNGAKVLFATDEWFATAENLLNDSPPEFDPDLYCEQGKVMDGWESRRRREAGHDWCLIRLSHQGTVTGVELDTAHFTGNHVPKVSLEVAKLSAHDETKLCQELPGCMSRLLHGGGLQGTGHSPNEVSQAEEACRAAGEWTEVLPQTALKPGYEETRMNFFKFKTPMVATHLRVNYYPDGGVARLRLWGSEGSQHERPSHLHIPQPKGCTMVAHKTGNMPSQENFKFPDLVCSTNGGIGLACSNKHYGEPSNLLQPTLGRDMGDGWETARHPNRPSVLERDPKTNLVASPLMDWAVLKLGKTAADGIARIVLDTKHFRGNYPESVTVEGCFANAGISDEIMKTQSETVVEWFPVVPRTRMGPDAEHVFEADLNQLENATRAVTHVRVSIYPDGGLSRVRVYGAPLEIGSEDIQMKSNL